MSHFKIIRPLAWIGLALASLGFGLFYRYLQYPIPYATQEVVQVVIVVGLGISLMVPLLAIQKAMPVSELGAITGAFSLSRAFGSTIGSSILSSIQLLQGKIDDDII